MTAHLSLRLRRGSHWLPRRWRLRLRSRRHSSRHTSRPSPAACAQGMLLRLPLKSASVGMRVLDRRRHGNIVCLGLKLSHMHPQKSPKYIKALARCIPGG